MESGDDFENIFNVTTLQTYTESDIIEEINPATCVYVNCQLLLSIWTIVQKINAAKMHTFLHFSQTLLRM